MSSVGGPDGGEIPCLIPLERAVAEAQPLTAEQLEQLALVFKPAVAAARQQRQNSREYATSDLGAA